ncbi:MAG: hypothetical protein EU518_02045 [Promethearchaeota archaeon]|nr:MAG: hypothetical protein EU518_02045 [Candidatus Lokiarchaeota archaeon]
MELDNLEPRILKDPNQILNYLQYGTNLPIISKLKKYILEDLISLKAELILLLEDGNPSGITLVYSDKDKTLYFGYFKVLNDNEIKIDFLIEELINYAKRGDFKFIEGPINIPTIIFGWGFQESGKDSIFIGKPINSPIYQQRFLKKKFTIKNRQESYFFSPIPNFDPLKIKKYNYRDYKYFNPKNFEDFLNLKDEFLKIQAKNLPKSSQITPNSEKLVENYAKFIFEFGFNFMIQFVKHKPSQKIIACGAAIPNVFRKNLNGKIDSCAIFTAAINKKHRGMGIGTFMFGKTSQLLHKNNIRDGSAPIDPNNLVIKNLLENLGGRKSRTHIILEKKIKKD